MNARVDVLAVMGRMATASFVAAFDHPESAALARLQRDTEVARAAVAELIEAARGVTFNARFTADEDAYHEVTRDEMTRLTAALSAVKL